MKKITEHKPIKIFYCWHCHTGCESDEYERADDFGVVTDICPKCGYTIFT